MGRCLGGIQAGHRVEPEPCSGPPLVCLLSGPHQPARASHCRNQSRQRLDPLSLPVNVTLRHILCNARQYDQAIQTLKKVLELDPATRSLLVPRILLSGRNVRGGDHPPSGSYQAGSGFSRHSDSSRRGLHAGQPHADLILTQLQDKQQVCFTWRNACNRRGAGRRRQHSLH